MNNKKIFVGLAIIAIIIIAFLVLTKGGSPTGEVIQTQDTVKIPLTDITEKAIFYNHEGSNYFAVKATDGSIKTAFDACDVCGGEKGYRQEGNDIICNNCGRHFNINYLGEKNVFGGGCWPSHLENRIEEEYIVIEKSELTEGSFRF